MTNSLILIVDDNYKNLQVLGSTLKEAKFKTAIATNGLEAIDFVNKKIPDLILLDIMMPQIDGLEVCRRLKSNKETSKIPIVFLTAKTDAETIREAFEVGGQDYISKPFKSVELLARVKTHLEIHQNRKILENMNIHLEQEVEKRTAELQKANLELSKMEKAKGDFLNLISHELRTPLNAIKGFSYILKDAVSDEKYLEFIDEINEAANKLVRVSDVSLLITSLQFNNFKKRNVQINLQEFLNNTIYGFTAKYKLDSSKIHKQIQDEMPVVVIETTLISNAVSMILDNAFKHSPEDGNIHFEAAIENNTIIIKISDQGVGFTERALLNIFNFFTEKTLFSASGLGIGLATVKLIMDSIGGTISVSNIEPRGAQVVLQFPTNR